MQTMEVFDEEFEKTTKPRRYTLVNTFMRIVFVLIFFGSVYQLYIQYALLNENRDLPDIEQISSIEIWVPIGFSFLVMSSIVLVWIEWKYAILVSIAINSFSLLGVVAMLFYDTAQIAQVIGGVIMAVFLFYLFKIRKKWEQEAVGRSGEA